MSPVDEAGNPIRDKDLRDILVGPKPVIKSPLGFFNSYSITYKREEDTIPKSLTSGNLIQKAIYSKGTYKGPKIDVEIDGGKTIIRTKNNSTEVESGKQSHLELEERTVEIPLPSEETKEIHDPRLENVDDIDQEMITVSKMSVQEFDVNPIVKIDNIGYVDVYVESEEESEENN